jgi:hypothetical protein
MLDSLPAVLFLDTHKSLILINFNEWRGVLF